jgi:hypothetical protein
MNMNITTNRLSVIAFELKKSSDLASYHAEEWLQAARSCALLMAEARALIPSDMKFSIWLVENGCGHFSNDDRAALIEIGHYPEVLNEVLDVKGRLRDMVKGKLPEILAHRNIKPKNYNAEAEMDHPVDDPSNNPSGSSLTNPTDIPSPPETTVEKSEIDDSIGHLGSVPAPAIPIGGRPLKLAAIMGKHNADGLLVKGFMPKGGRALAVLTKLASKPGGGVAAIKRMAAELRTGVAGAGHQQNPEFGCAMFFPDLPRGFVTARNYPETVSGLNALLGDLSVLAEIDKRLKADKPYDASHAALRLWRELKGAPAISAPVPVSARVMEHTLPGPDLSAFGPLETYTKYGRAPSPDAHYAPQFEDDIIVCGQVIYKKGSETPEIFRHVFSAYSFFDLLDRQLTLSEPKVVTRGYTWRRLSIWPSAANPVFGLALWNIGNAMANHPDRWAERSAPPKIPNVVK